MALSNSCLSCSRLYHRNSNKVPNIGVIPPSIEEQISESPTNPIVLEIPVKEPVIVVNEEGEKYSKREIALTLALFLVILVIRS